ncbi:exonuclease domain-containing protein [Agrobacterium rubi]|nr:exonuclease domain-containing protein [Agrobacterium rubi]NTF24531.1 exonuclease domain-containing protein [Agrobacterium rubi]
MTNQSIPKYDVRDDRNLFVDVEMTCWDGLPPEGEAPEIIEIGVAELDLDTLEVTRSRSYLVKPVFSSISAFCTDLTGIAPADIKRTGRPLIEVGARIAKDFGSRSKQWISWGADRRALDRDHDLKNVPPTFSAAFMDMGLDFKHSLGMSRGIGLTRAMELYGLERTGRIHSGEQDAVDTALLWAEMARRRRDELAYMLDRLSAPSPLP